MKDNENQIRQDITLPKCRLNEYMVELYVIV